MKISFFSGFFFVRWSKKAMVSGYLREDKMNASMMYNELSFKKKTARVDWRKIGKHFFQSSNRNYLIQKNFFFPNSWD